MKIEMTIASLLFGAAALGGCNEDPTETGSGLTGQEVMEEGTLGMEEDPGDEGIQVTPQAQPRADQDDVDLARPAPGGATRGGSWQMQSGGAEGETPDVEPQ